MGSVFFILFSHPPKPGCTHQNNIGSMHLPCQLSDGTQKPYLHTSHDMNMSMRPDFLIPAGGMLQRGAVYTCLRPDVITPAACSAEQESVASTAISACDFTNNCCAFRWMRCQKRHNRSFASTQSARVGSRQADMLRCARLLASCLGLPPQHRTMPPSWR